MSPLAAKASLTPKRRCRPLCRRICKRRIPRKRNRKAKPRKKKRPPLSPAVLRESRHPVAAASPVAPVILPVTVDLVAQASCGAPSGPPGPAAPAAPVVPATPPAPAVSIRPIVQRYFYVPTQEIDLAAPAVIPANQFVDDRGEPASRIADYGEQGFFDLYVNGVMQEGSLYDVAPERVVLQAAGGTISAGTPVIVQSVGFSIFAKLT